MALCALLARGHYDGEAASLSHGSSLLIKDRRCVDAPRIFAHYSPYKQNLPMDNVHVRLSYFKTYRRLALGQPARRPPPLPAPLLGSPCGGCVDGNFSVARRADFKGSSCRGRGKGGGGRGEEKEKKGTSEPPPPARARAYLVPPPQEKGGGRWAAKKREEKEKKSAVNVCSPGIFRAMRDRAAKWR